MKHSRILCSLLALALILCPAGSSAEDYAVENGFPFLDLP